MQDDDILCSEAEWAAEAHKSVPWARRERRLGRSPAYVKVGRTPMYRRGDIRAWLAARRVAIG